MLRRAGAVFVFDPSNETRLRAEHGVALPEVFRLGDFDPRWTGRREISDPWGMSPEGFRATFERIERCVEDALDAMGRLSGARER